MTSSSDSIINRALKQTIPYYGIGGFYHMHYGLDQLYYTTYVCMYVVNMYC